MTKIVNRIKSHFKQTLCKQSKKAKEKRGKHFELGFYSLKGSPKSFIHDLLQCLPNLYVLYFFFDTVFLALLLTSTYRVSYMLEQYVGPKPNQSKCGCTHNEANQILKLHRKIFQSSQHLSTLLDTENLFSSTKIFFTHRYT